MKIERAVQELTYLTILEELQHLKIILSTAKPVHKTEENNDCERILKSVHEDNSAERSGYRCFLLFGDTEILRKLTDQFRINDYAGPKYNTPSFGVGGVAGPFHFHGGDFLKYARSEEMVAYKDKIQFNGNET